MAGFFGFFDFTKPGPGVPKDAPPKARIIVFFEIFGRKFWNLVKINLMFNLFNLPAILAMFYALQFLFPNYIVPGNAADPDIMTSEFFTRFMFGAVLLCIPVITVGPAQAGFTYILRNYAREEHAFVWWDFKDTALSNLKQSIAICLIDFVAVIVFGFTINFYLSFKNGNIFMSLATSFIILAFVVFLMMHLYIYPMLVTFKLTVRQIYKNAFLFAVMKFIPNLGILLLCTLILFLTLGFYPIIGITLYLLLTVSTIGLITNFYVYPKIKKYMIDRVEAEESDEEEDEEEYEDGEDQEDGDGQEELTAGEDGER